MKYGILTSKDIQASMRIDGSFHLSDGVALERLISKRPHKLLFEFCDNIFTAGRRKRTYTKKEFGYPYLSNSDVISQNPFNSCKYNSRKYGHDESAFLKEGMILTGRVGAIGQTAYVTREFEDKETMGSDNIIRILAKQSELSGYIYAFLVSKMGNTLLWKLAAGGVQPYITDQMVANIPVPIFPEPKQQEIHNLIVESANLRVEANRLLEEAKSKLLVYANLPQLTIEDYDYFGARANGRNVSYFSKNIKAIDSTTINAFNHSIRIETTKRLVIDACETVPLEKMLDDKKLFSTGSFPRVEVKPENGIMLINQKDIFDTIVRGKRISRRKVKLDNLVEYGEVLIAGVGTLGENETFCRSIFANEDLKGQLVSGEFIRMKTKDRNLSGYLFAWLSSDYGFRLIRNTQTGTKLCRPILRLLLQIPVPVLDLIQMKEIDDMIKKAHSFYYKSNSKENQAIQLVEKEIESWQ